MSQSVPTTNYLHGYKDVRHHEIRTAETDAAYLLPILATMAEANPQLSLLVPTFVLEEHVHRLTKRTQQDIGAGSGTISASLAKYMPQGMVTAVDLSNDILQQAAEHAKRVGSTNMQFQTASVFDLPFQSATFDIVHTSQMLCYQSDPVSAMREMLRVLKPGGVAAIRECDMRMWSFWPKLPELERFLEIQLATHEAGGGTNFAGPQLISWAMQAGMKREQVTMSASSWCYSEPHERQTWGHSWAQRIRAGAVGQKAVAMNLASMDQLESMACAWERWAAAEDACFAAMHGQILIRK